MMTTKWLRGEIDTLDKDDSSPKVAKMPSHYAKQCAI